MIFSQRRRERKEKQARKVIYINYSLNPGLETWLQFNDLFNPLRALRLCEKLLVHYIKCVESEK